MSGLFNIDFENEGVTPVLLQRSGSSLFYGDKSLGLNHETIEEIKKEVEHFDPKNVVRHDGVVINIIYKGGLDNVSGNPLIVEYIPSFLVGYYKVIDNDYGNEYIKLDFNSYRVANMNLIRYNIGLTSDEKLHEVFKLEDRMVNIRQKWSYPMMLTDPTIDYAQRDRDLDEYFARPENRGPGPST